MLGASNHCETEREVNDFYATDPKAIDALLTKEAFNKNVWECAVGKGHLAERLKQYGYSVRCSDIIDRGYPNTEILDFKYVGVGVFNGDIITNPPYKYTTEFILNALSIVPNGNKVAMFLKLQTLEGVNRYKSIYSTQPPKTIYVFTKRIKCFFNGIDDGKSSAIAYAWFVWQKGFKGKTTIEFI